MNEQDIPVYNAEQWWTVCKDLQPELTREEFNARWNQFVLMANFLGLWRPL